MAKQQLIELHTSVDGKKCKYTGRFLGFIKDDEFNALVQNTEEVATRLESKATQPIMEVVAKFDNMIGYRLVMVVKKIDGEDMLKKMLFITEGLALIDTVTPGSDEKNGKVTFQSNDQEIITVEEAE